MHFFKDCLILFCSIFKCFVWNFAQLLIINLAWSHLCSNILLQQPGVLQTLLGCHPVPRVPHQQMRDEVLEDNTEDEGGFQNYLNLLALFLFLGIEGTFCAASTHLVRIRLKNRIFHLIEFQKGKFQILFKKDSLILWNSYIFFISFETFPG